MIQIDSVTNTKEKPKVKSSFKFNKERWQLVQCENMFNTLNPKYKRADVGGLFDKEIIDASVAHICMKMKKFQNMSYAIENEIEEHEVEEHRKNQEDEYYEQYGIEYNDDIAYGQSNQSQEWYDVLQDNEVELLVRALLDNFV